MADTPSTRPRSAAKFTVQPTPSAVGTSTWESSGFQIVAFRRWKVGGRRSYGILPSTTPCHVRCSFGSRSSAYSAGDEQGESDQPCEVSGASAVSLRRPVRHVFALHRYESSFDPCSEYSRLMLPERFRIVNGARTTRATVNKCERAGRTICSFWLATHPGLSYLQRTARRFSYSWPALSMSWVGRHEPTASCRTSNSPFYFSAVFVRRCLSIYWCEILYRTHLAAATSLIRFSQWVSGAHQSSEDGYLMALAACYRGLIESAADTWDGLGSVGVTLAENGNAVEDGLRVELAQVVMSTELEDSLIHFQFARKTRRGEDAPSSHQAKRVADYLTPLVRIEPQFQLLYGRLCDTTHPGASSVLAFTHENPDRHWSFTTLQPHHAHARSEGN